MERFITEANLQQFAATLAGKKHVLAPVASGGTTCFRRLVPGMRLDFSRMAVISPKDATFPRNETLLLVQRYVEESGKKLELKEQLPEGECIVIGSRPCGARGKLIFDPVYETEAIKDPYYLRRRDNTLFITLSCDRPESTCFCHSVGSNPADGTGSDVLLTAVEGGFFARAITPKGEELLADALFEEAGTRAEEAAAKQTKARELMGQAHDFSSAAAKLLERFDDMGFWQAQSNKCISCGACTYMCPTCYCFNITDDEAGLVSRRLRSWDNCMSHTFTLEGSGHNPRGTKAHRLKNRVGHKFSYYPDLHASQIACCGCGRCIKQCPAGVDIRQVVMAAQEYVDER
ncbi:MAG: hydrogenase [Desulfobulbaceae bacterium]|nr:hydrogenase [Desulfobulbaceae bacterium]